MITQGVSLQRRGSSAANATPVAVGTATLVTGGSNTNGIIVRTATLYSTGSDIAVLAGGTAIILLPPNGVFTYQGPGIVIPPGQAFQLAASATGGGAQFTFDLL